MQITAVGINHTTAPIEMRERAAITADRVVDAVQALVDVNDIAEATILSTCNRTEIYCGHELGSEAPIIDWFCDFQQLPSANLSHCAYSHHNKDAVNHAFRVASGLDSMVLGEPQILGQMKAGI